MIRSLLVAVLVAAAHPAPPWRARRHPTTRATSLVAEGNNSYLQLHAEGVQIYSCNGQAWTLRRAAGRPLYDGGRHVGTHFAGPTWKLMTAAHLSPLRGRRQRRPDGDDWLLLDATPTAEGRLW